MARQARKTERIGQIRPLNIEHIVLEVEGLPPGLLTHRYQDNDQPKAPKPYTEEFALEEAERGLYPLDPARQGAQYGIPTMAFKGAMVETARILPGVNMTDLRQAIFVEPTQDLLLPIREMEWQVHTVRAVIQKAAVLRSRPLFPAGWRVTVPIRFNAGALTATDVANLLNLAGDCVGVGDWRPSKNGEYGRFKVVEA